MKSFTKDEKYLIALQEIAKAQGEPYLSCDMYDIGVKQGLNERTVNNIVKLLAQTNFIKKHGDNKISLTPHGESLIQSLYN